jgi:predicted RNA-binding protein YlxR (DUF448 family)
VTSERAGLLIADESGAEAVVSASRERRCIVTGDVLPEARLIRFVAGPDGRVVPDVEAKLDGRGLWVRSERETITKAVTKGLFARAAKAPVVAEAGLVAVTEARLVQRMLDQLGLARRAGALLLGFDQVETALRGKQPPAVVIEAAEAAEDGQRKLRAAATSAGIFPFVIGALTGDELSLALARPNVVHAAVKSGRIAERLIFEAERLAGFRPLRPWVWAGFQARTGGGSG